MRAVFWLSPLIPALVAVPLVAVPALANTDADDATIDVTGSDAGGAASTGTSPLAPVPLQRVASQPAPGREAASPARLLRRARDAAAEGRDGAAGEWLERAETRLLARAASPRRAEEPDTSPVVEDIDAARAALSSHDRQGAVVHIDAALGRLSPAPVASSVPALSLAAPPAPPPPAAGASSLSVLPQEARPPGAPPVPATAAGIRGRWQWNGAGYVFVAPQAEATAQPSAPVLPSTNGDWRWYDGKWVWSPRGG